MKRRPCYRALATFKRPPVRLKKQKQLRLFTHRQQQRHSLGSSRFLLLISTRCSSTAHRQIVTVLYCQKINNLLRIVSQKLLFFFFVALCSYRKVLNVVSWCGSEWGFPARSNGIRAPLGRKENWRQRQRLFDRARLSVGAEFRPMSKSKIVVLRNDDVRKDSGPRPTAFYAECAGQQVPLCSQTSRALSRRSVIILIFCQSGPSAWKNGGHCLIAVFAFCCCCFFSSWGPGSPIGRNKPLQLQRRSFLTAN